MARIFRDRAEAGRTLASHMEPYTGRDDVVVLALPRGGVPVGFEVAHALQCPFDIFVVRKLGAPAQEELAIGAIASGGIRVLNREALRALQIPQEQIDRIAEREQRELERREQAYRGSREPVAVEGKTVILVDDGLATGSSMRAAAEALLKRRPREIVVAVPVASRSTCDNLRQSGAVTAVICATTPEPFYAVGQWYERFEQTSDEEVHQLLRRSASEKHAA
jgi:predicted phosphoribosyltransferase